MSLKEKRFSYRQHYSTTVKTARQEGFEKILFLSVFPSKPVLKRDKKVPAKSGDRKRVSSVTLNYTGASVADCRLTIRMTTMYITTTNARNSSVESTLPISAQAS